MKIQTFLKNDRVRYIKEDIYQPHQGIYYYGREAGLIINNIYIVESSTTGYLHLKGYSSLLFKKSCFELAENNTIKEYGIAKFMRSKYV
jgi:hypothetical protein